MAWWSRAAAVWSRAMVVFSRAFAASSRGTAPWGGPFDLCLFGFSALRSGLAGRAGRFSF